MDRRVVSELCQVKEFVQSLWVVTEKTPEVLFKGAINNFGLAISFWMVSRAKFQLCSLDLEKFSPKLAEE